MKRPYVKEPSMRRLIVEALKITDKPMRRDEILSFVVKQMGVFSIKPHSFSAALSILRKKEEIQKDFGSNCWIINSKIRE